jgi:Spy/CpxP family protein refolding chaperone
MKRSQSTALIFAFLLFACGVAIGALGHRYYTSSTVMAKSAEDYRQHYVAEMQGKLKLTPKQVAQLQVILDETKAKARSVREQYRPAIVTVKEEQVRRVKSILNSEQVPAYDRLVAQHERHFREAEQRDRQQDQKESALHRQQAADAR